MTTTTSPRIAADAAIFLADNFTNLSSATESTLASLVRRAVAAGMDPRGLDFTPAKGFAGTCDGCEQHSSSLNVDGDCPSCAALRAE